MQPYVSSLLISVMYISVTTGDFEVFTKIAWCSSLENCVPQDIQLHYLQKKLMVIYVKDMSKIEKFCEITIVLE